MYLAVQPGGVFIVKLLVDISATEAFPELITTSRSDEVLNYIEGNEEATDFRIWSFAIVRLDLILNREFEIGRLDAEIYIYIPCHLHKPHYGAVISILLMPTPFLKKYWD